MKEFVSSNSSNLCELVAVEPSWLYRALIMLIFEIGGLVVRMWTIWCILIRIIIIIVY